MCWVGYGKNAKVGLSAKLWSLAHFSLGRTELAGRGLKLSLNHSVELSSFHLPQNWQILKYYPFMKCLYNRVCAVTFTNINMYIFGWCFILVSSAHVLFVCFKH